ncbi:MAG: hypothetical protein KGL29_02340 [Alphaproteobacteria bacterium]|nr:hypothetical protein [Alphaproteobacteria bacterium]MDE2264714.1 hypothetical protein [Alphaproteobacteria bacterium]MDE2499535.1 hypothetical protein [Alphaproteobacteria bacterium]
MEPTKDQLAAFIDGELSMEDMQKMKESLAQRPDLATYVEQQMLLQARLSDTFAPLMDEAVPQYLRDAVMSAPISMRYRIAARLRAMADNVVSVQFALRSLVPAAAALACGLLIGMSYERGTQSGLQTLPTGQIIAQGVLASALTNQLASAGVPASGPRIGVSFQNRTGQDCRTFSLPGSRASTSGVACRQGADWIVAALAKAPGETRGAYQQAGTEMPPLIRNAVNAMIAGEAFDAVRERAARDRGWK